MRESFEFEGTSTGEYRGGLYVTYCGKDYPAVYLGVGRFVLYSDTSDENFTFPTCDGRYLLQTDLRDENLTRACDIHMVGIVRNCYESVIVHDILKEGIIISTYNPRLGFELDLKPVKKLGFTGLVDRNILIGMYEERDYLWNPALGICSTLCQVTGTKDKDSWFLENDRITQFYIKQSQK
ncbi:MAG: hypothetical protein J6C19_08625 [Lachnospiraceae bacterium]|nr:hypothetical protein [Lachnospiraceae bacterium]MBO5145582.1 hypothetical protein [Lachnospiraceae bacterium]